MAAHNDSLHLIFAGSTSYAESRVAVPRRLLSGADHARDGARCGFLLPGPQWEAAMSFFLCVIANRGGQIMRSWGHRHATWRESRKRALPNICQRTVVFGNLPIESRYVQEAPHNAVGKAT